MNDNYIRKDLLTKLSKKDKIKYDEISRQFRAVISSYKMNYVILLGCFALFCVKYLRN